ncbi:MAG: hypothetical protein E7082_08200 [Bacteroidales bacterium]|nr:hypothetical protein [Bacteroidales bacterium]
MKQLLQNRSFIGIILSVIIIAGISSVYFYPDAFEGKVLQQHDMQQGMANSHELQVHEAETGEKAWWTNSLFGGMPAFQISPDYPSTHLFSWITRAYGLFLPSPANLLAMMMLGMFIMLMAIKMKPRISLIGAIAWGLSSYYIIIIGAGHIWKFVTLAYVPPTIAGLIWLFRGRRLLGAGIAALFMMLQIASNHVQMSYYFSWVMAGFIIAYGIEAYKEKRMKQWGVNLAIFCGAMLLAVAANAPTLYHTYKYSHETIRGGHSELTHDEVDSKNETNGLDRDYITQYSYEKAETLSLLIPNIKGGESGSSLADTDEGRKLMRADRTGEMTLLQLFSPYFGGAEGTSGPVYVGAIIFALALFGAIAVRGPAKWALVVLTLLSIFLAWGRNMQWFTDLFIDFVPMYSKFRTVESILVIAEFTIPLLAMLGLREIICSENRTKMLRPLIISFGICALICLISIMAPSVWGDAVMTEGDDMRLTMYEQMGYLPQGFNMAYYPEAANAVESIRLGLVRSDALRSLLFLVLGAGAVWVMAGKKLSSTIGLLCLGALVAIDLFTVNKRYLDSDDFKTPAVAKSFTPSAADKFILDDPDAHFRVLNAANFNDLQTCYFHKSIGGYHAAKLTRYQDFIDRCLTSPDNPAFLSGVNMLNTKYFITDPNEPPVMNDYALGNAWFIEEIDYVDSPDDEIASISEIDPSYQAVADRKFEEILGGQPAPVHPDDYIELTDYAPARLKYKSNSQNGGIAVFSEVYFPWGWNATIDGLPTKIGRVNYILRAVQIPAGEHTIVMEFRPGSIAATNSLAYVAIILVYLTLAAGIITRLTRRKK